MKNLLFTLLIISFLSSCGNSYYNYSYDNNGVIKGDGPIVTSTIEIDHFTGIELSIAADVVLIPGATQKVVIEAQKNILDNISTEVRKENWQIKYKQSVRKSLNTKIYITTPYFKDLFISGSGDIVTQSAFNNNLNDVHISISGSGDVTLEGQAQEVKVSIAGSGDVDLDKFVVGDAFIDIAGSGDCRVDSRNYLKVNIAGSGDVQYKSNPNVKSSIVGSGTVSPY